MERDLPEHLIRFPCMQPWIGCHYESPLHKRLLVVGESHYLPRGSFVNLKPITWYTRRECDLTPCERQYIDTKENVRYGFSGERTGKTHAIYRHVGSVLRSAFDELNLPHDDFLFNHIAYYNYFLRPAKYQKSIRESFSLEYKDRTVAESVMQWVACSRRPELIVVASKFAGPHARKVLASLSATWCITFNPARSRWVRPFKTDFAEFLWKHKWLERCESAGEVVPKLD